MHVLQHSTRILDLDLELEHRHTVEAAQQPDGQHLMRAA